MEVDDAAPTGSGMFSISSLNEPNDLCSQFLFFSAGQPLVMDPALPLTSDSGSTHGKSRHVIHKASVFLTYLKKAAM